MNTATPFVTDIPHTRRQRRPRTNWSLVFAGFLAIGSAIVAHGSILLGR